MPEVTPALTHDESPLDRGLDALPAMVRRSLIWHRQPQAKWLRPPLSLALVAGGFLGFLPILGFWTLPVGLILLGEDVPAVKRFIMKLLGTLQSWWDSRPRQGRR